MNPIQSPPNVLIALSESTVAILIALRRGDETLDTVIARCADLARNAAPVIKAPVSASVPTVPTSKAPLIASTTSPGPALTSGTYVASVLGVPVSADTLGALFRNVVDAIHHVDPASIERLSLMKARTRRYVARERDQVHAGRRDLPVLNTRSGWWVSGNVGRPDLARSLRAICQASGLLYGHDIRFPA
ncbi:MAG: hypothetical protein JJU40_01795 [Rhodobacteraceae bacterium]|nr:hypothetical protein [Paracoccaceae bacterium]